MSSPLAIASVTAVLRNLLDNGMIESNVVDTLGTNVTVTAMPPDTIPLDSANATTQLNLFLHQVTPNPGWRNMGLPSSSPRGDRVTNAPLALDLHYLLTAYGADELHAEILLGFGMYLMHERPVLDRKSIRSALSNGAVDPSILPLAYQALSAADLADQMEQVKITTLAMTSEEMSKIWSSLNANYRPTAAYSVSVVLIEAEKPTRSSLPVLTRGKPDPVTGREPGISAITGLIPPFPSLSSVEYPANQLAAEIGDTIIFHGHHLNGTNLEVQFEHDLLDKPKKITVGTNVNSDQLSVTLALPDGPPGSWRVRINLVRQGESEVRSTNVIPFFLAPKITIGSSSATRDGETGAVTVQLVFTPEVILSQDISLNVGGHEALPDAFENSTGSLVFGFPKIPSGNQWVRLRVDGVDSLLVNRAASPPNFIGTQWLDIPV